MRLHVVAYLAHTPAGPEFGVARVPSDHDRPTWAQYAEVIPGFLAAHYLGPAPEPLFTLRYETAAGRSEKTLTASGIELVGQVVTRAADCGEAWNVEVLNAAGDDVTFDFSCFA